MTRIIVGFVSVGIFVLFAISSAVNAMGTEDFKGSKDHSLIPRIQDSYIIGYQFDEFNDVDLILGKAKRVNRAWVPEKVETQEGKRTRILYAAPKTRSTLEILRNYQKALNEIGTVEDLFSCKGRVGCGSTTEVIGGYEFLRLFWTPDKYIPGNFGEVLWNVGDPPVQDERYWIGKLTHPNGVVYVSLYVAINTDIRARKFKKLDQPIVLVDILEVKAMESVMLFVNADKMASEIAKEGHIALYGIYFDFDSDKLKHDSDESLNEINKLLSSDPNLNLLVVGHTDGKGSGEYNLGLSTRRANSVIKALVNRYGIASSRLSPFGNGYYAPVATNRTEEGRAKNRRVELVELYIERPKTIPLPTKSTAGTESTGDDIKTRLMRLKSLKDKGLIDESEYDHKRKEILESL